MVSLFRWTDSPDMTIAVDCNVKHQTNKTNKKQFFFAGSEDPYEMSHKLAYLQI